MWIVNILQFAIRFRRRQTSQFFLFENRIKIVY